MYRNKQKEKEFKSILKNSNLNSQLRKIWKHQNTQNFIHRCVKITFVLMDITYRIY